VPNANITIPTNPNKTKKVAGPLDMPDLVILLTTGSRANDKNSEISIQLIKPDNLNTKNMVAATDNTVIIIVITSLVAHAGNALSSLLAIIQL
jgi:hypothetical protein